MLKDIRRRGFVLIGDTPWALVYKNKLPNGDLGQCNPETETLYIRTRQALRDEVATFFHEWLHGCEVEYDFDLGHPVINKLEYWLADLFLNNF